MLGIMSLAEKTIEEARRQITDELLPVHALITQLIKEQQEGVIAQLPTDRVIQKMKAERLHSDRERIKRMGVWGLKLSIKPTEGGGTWIKVTNVFYRMCKAAGNDADIGHKKDIDPDSALFRPANQQFPYHETVTLILCAVGPLAQQSLQEAVLAEREFDPRQWDSDGYYVG